MDSLSKQDYEWLEKIIKVTTSIKNIYKNMADLEIRGKNDTNEYKQLLNLLKNLINIENIIYENGNLTYLKCDSIINYIIENKIPSDFLTDTESIILQNYNNVIFRRIVNNLLEKIFSDHVKEYVSSMLKVNNNYLNNFCVNIKLQNAIELDGMNGFLSFLQEFINQKDYRTFKDNLIYSKYNVLFINKNIEAIMIENDFIISESFYVTSRFIADLTKTDLELYSMLKETYGINKAIKQIIEILNMSNIDYGDSSKSIASILRQCLIRSSFTFIDDSTIKNFNCKFKEYIESKEYIEKHPDNSISEQIIINCFENVKKDSIKQIVLSLG